MAATADLSACRDRCQWVEQALHALNQEIAGWLAQNDPYATTVEYQPEADVHVFRLDPEVPPVGMWIAASNVIHQLRAVLDNLVWQLVMVNRRKPRGGRRGNAFPILLPNDMKTGTFKNKTSNSLRGVHSDHRAVIEGLQPYKQPATGQLLGVHPLERLRERSNADKHQELKVGVTLHSPDHQPVVSFEGDNLTAVRDWWFNAPPHVEAGAVIGWAELDPPGCHPDVHMKAGGVFLMDFTDAYGGLMGILWTLAASVEAIVEAFAPALDGKPVVPLTLSPSEVQVLFDAYCARDPLTTQSRAWGSLWTELFG